MLALASRAALARATRPAVLTGASLLWLAVAPVPAHALVPVAQTFSDGTDMDQDDMSIWVHPTNTALSTVITTDKSGATVYVYDLDGNVLQTIASPHPGNVDVRYGFELGADCVDLVAFNERDQDLIRVYRVDPVTRLLTHVDDGGIVVDGSYGSTLYRHGDGRLFVYTGPKGSGAVVRQYELFDDGTGTVAGAQTDWAFDETTVEGMVGDDETGYVYLAEEDVGIWRVDALDASDKMLIAAVGDASNLTADVEGVAIYHTATAGGYLLASSQGTDDFRVYGRQPPHVFLGTFAIAGVGDTDGIDVVNLDLGPPYSQGIFTFHNGDNCCHVQAARWQDIAAELGLVVDTSSWDPRTSNTDCSSVPTTLPGSTTTTTLPSIPTTTLPAGAVTFEGVEGGAATGAALVTTGGDVAAVDGELYLAAIATKPAIAVVAVSGLGLDWNEVTAQCAGRGQTGLAVWATQGTAFEAGPVTGMLQTAATNAVIAVSRYGGVDSNMAIGSLASGNTNGSFGACTGGVDSGDYAFTLPTGASDSLIYSAVAMRMKTHFPGPELDERIELIVGQDGAAASVAVQDRVVGISPAGVNGMFNGDVDWAVVAAELVAAPAAATTTTTTMPPAPSPCSAAPADPATCRFGAPGRSLVRMNTGRAKLSWKWKKGEATTMADFGDPGAGTSRLHVCLYDTSQLPQPLVDMELPSDAACGGAPCWRALGDKGLRFKDATGIPDGALAGRLRVGEDGRAQVRVKAGGPSLLLPNPPPDGLTLPVTVQLIADHGAAAECWQSTFSTAKRNDVVQFKAKGP